MKKPHYKECDLKNNKHDDKCKYKKNNALHPIQRKFRDLKKVQNRLDDFGFFDDEIGTLMRKTSYLIFELEEEVNNFINLNKQFINSLNIEIWCFSCEVWVTNDWQSCYCECLCKLKNGDDDCIFNSENYELINNGDKNCKRNTEWSIKIEGNYEKYIKIKNQLNEIRLKNE